MIYKLGAGMVLEGDGLDFKYLWLCCAAGGERVHGGCVSCLE
jgi:hypothetical protein